MVGYSNRGQSPSDLLPNNRAIGHDFGVCKLREIRAVLCTINQLEFNTRHFPWEVLSERGTILSRRIAM